MDQLQENYFLRIDLTVESSLFANKFTSPWTCLQTFVEYLLKLSRTNLLPTKLRLHEPGKFQLPTNIDHYK